MAATPGNPQPSPARDLTLYCAASCDLNHAAVPHPPWDCNAPDNPPTINEATRRVLADLDPDRLPWVRYATPLVLSAGELDRLRSPISSAMFSLRVDEDARDLGEAEQLSQRLEAIDQRLIRTSLDAQRASTRLDVPARFSCADANQLRQVMGEAAGRLDDYARRRDAANPGYLLGSEHFTKAAEELRGWAQATLERQQQRPTARSEPAITASLQLTDHDREHLREEADHRRQLPTGRGGRGER